MSLRFDYLTVRRPIVSTQTLTMVVRVWRAGLALGLLAALAACGGTSPAAGPAAMSELGIFEPGVPESYSPVTSFTAASGLHPNLDVYYSGWYQPFQAAFATAAAQHGAEALVQIDPADVDLAAIAAGTYDSYLRSFAGAVRSYGDQVVLSFGHEMNASWYSWGFPRTSPATFVAAWRHVVTLFRDVGTTNVIWLWTVNVTGSSQTAPIAPWWPGGSYVTWVGLDGYFFRMSQTFTSLFGPTIAAVRALTSVPVLIAETGATPSADKPAKIASLFAGAHRYGLLGFVWFDADTHQDWRVSHDPAAMAALRTGAAVYMKNRPLDCPDNYDYCVILAQLTTFISRW
jgi:mannan endo-1,4-beta-mannosidase